MRIPEDIAQVYDEILDMDLAQLDSADIEQYRKQLDHVYHLIEMLEPEDKDGESFLEWEELLETLDDCYDDLFEYEEGQKD